METRNYKINKLIGYGRNGVVYKGIDKRTNNNVAIKIYELSDCLILKPCVLREVSVLSKLSKLKHPNIIKCHDIFFWNNKLLIILELCDDNLFDYINNFNDNNEVKNMEKKHFLEILSAIHHIHNLNYIHNDLSLSNVMIKNDNIKIIDFSSSLKKYRKYNNKILPTLNVRPIELVSNNLQTFVDKIDIWSLGIIQHFILTKRILINCTNENDYLDEIMKNFNNKLYKLHKSKFNKINANYKDIKIMKKMFQFNPKKRISINKIKKKYNNELIKFNIVDNVNDAINHKTNDYIYDIICYLLNIIISNNMNYEIIESVIINYNKYKTSKINKNKNDTIIEIIILFWISTNIINHELLNITNIIHIAKKYFGLKNIKDKINKKNIKKKYKKICKELKWNLDPDTSFKYIVHITDKYKKIVRKLNAMILIVPNNISSICNVERILVIYHIVDYKDKYSNKFIKKFKNTFIKKSYDDMVKNYIIIAKIINYLTKQKENKLEHLLNINLKKNMDKYKKKLINLFNTI